MTEPDALNVHKRRRVASEPDPITAALLRSTPLHSDVVSVVRKYAAGRVLDVKVLADHNRVEYVGVMLLLDDPTTPEIAVMTDNVQTCCESWYVTVTNTANRDQTVMFQHANDSDANTLKSWLVWSEIVDVRWNHKRVPKSKNYELHVACVDITTQDTTFEVDVHCDHNGWYPHDLWVKWKNYEDHQNL